MVDILTTYITTSPVCPFYSGLTYSLTEWIMGITIQICFGTTKTLGLIKFLKFVQLMADNMVVITNLGVCVNVALIVEVRE